MLFVSPQKLFLSFCLDILVMYKYGLIKKIGLVLNFMTSKPGKQTVAIHMLPNIPMTKDNQTMKFGQAMKSYTEFGEETILRYFSKKPKLSISLDLKSKVLCSLFLLYAKLRAIEIY